MRIPVPAGLRLAPLLGLLAGLPAPGQTTDLPELSARERAQGFRDGFVMAKPRADHRAVIDDEESREGTGTWRKFAAFGGLRVIAVRKGETAAGAVRRLKASGRYEFVEPDFVRRAYALPNDPSFAQQWGLNNTGANPTISAPGVAGADIGAVAAWNTRTDTGGVVVAVVDSGALLTHSDLQANLWQNPQQNQDGFRNDLYGINATVSAGSSSSGTPSDNDGHGTHVSGIIGAVGNNGTGTTGVAWKTQLMELKFIGSNGRGSTSAEVTCLNFALSHGASLVNASFGSSQSSLSEFTALQALRAAGIIFVAAAGNDSENNDLSPSYPAGYLLDNIVTVACSDNRDDAVYFTASGCGTVDLFAPGYQIVSLYNNSNTATATLSGTSMSAPFVTGSLALLKAQYPGDNYRQLINRLLRAVDANPNFLGRAQTGGRLNLARALTSLPDANTPFNDGFDGRARLAGGYFTVRSSNAGASRESGEPIIPGPPGGASLWWEWTAPVSGPVTLSTAGSAYPTLVGVYTGTAVGSLVPVASGAAAGAGSSTAAFTAQAGATYEFTVDGQAAATGLTVLNLNYGNDAFASPAILAGANPLVSASNIAATREASEPQILGAAGGHSLWYAWTAPASGQFQVAAFSPDFDPLLAVYTGDSLGTLTQVAAASGATIVSSASTPGSTCTCAFAAVAGTTYRISIDGAIDGNSANQQYTFNSLTPIGAGEFTLSITDAAWQAVAGDSLTGAPAAGADGTVYIGGDDGTFYAYRPDGTLRWSFPTTSGITFDTSAPALSPDGAAVYAGASDGTFYAFDAGTGAQLWKVSLAVPPVACSPAVAADGTIYVKDCGSTFYAFNPDGSLKWTHAIAGTSYASPSIAPDGTIYIGSDDSNLYALTPAGTLKWSFAAAAPIFNAPAIDAGGSLYFGTLGGGYFALTPAGRQIWSLQLGKSISSSPAISASGRTLYFGSYDHRLYALDTATGAQQWSFATGGEIRACSPALDASGIVYVGSYDGNLYAVNPDGTLHRTYATGNWIRSSPVIAGTRLCFGSNDHHLYAYSVPAGPAPSPWAMFMNNPGRFGRALAGNAPVITAQPTGMAVNAGSSPVLSVSATGGNLAYQWRRNGVAIPGATGPSLTLPNVAATQAGSYSVVIHNGAGLVTSAAAAISVTTDARLVNLSILSTIHGTLGMGFVIGGGQAGAEENLLIRAIGPSVGPGTAFNLPAVLPDPVLAVVQQAGAKLTVASDSGWGTPPSNAAAVRAADLATGAFDLPSTASQDSALVAALPAVAGGYSAAVSGRSGDGGTALTEVYDATANPTPASPRLVNLSCLTQIAAGATLNVGFVIGGTTSETLLIRAAGPTLALAPFSLAATLPDPQLSVSPLDSPLAVLASNAGWAGDAGVAAAAAGAGAFAFSSPASRDSAVLVTLKPGIPYAVTVSSATGAGGTVLVEIYEVR